MKAPVCLHGVYDTVARQATHKSRQFGGFCGFQGYGIMKSIVYMPLGKRRNMDRREPRETP